ncbi:MAG: PstS family phosphate ABC transporter substrate-binding protein [Opitutales bacterium]
MKSKIPTNIRRYTSALAALACAVSLQSEAVTVDPGLPEYEPVSGVSGNLNSIGSDTLNNLMTLWAEGFEEIYPDVNIQIEGKGSSTAPPALIAGTAQLGPMSREMKASEADEFEKEYGYKPTPVPTAIDALAVFVNLDNPMDDISLEEVDATFSSTHRLGGEPVETWGDLGVTGSLEDRSVSLYGRNSASGTYGFFKKVALGGGDFSSNVKEQPGSSSVVQSVGSDITGIGYSGIGYKTSGVKAIQLDGKEPSAENALDGSYPLARPLLVYVNRDPRSELDTLTREFLRFVLSREGQEVVVKDGYYPLPEAQVKKLRKTLK